MCSLIKSTPSTCLRETLERAFMPRRPTIPFLGQHQDEKSHELELNEDMFKLYTSPAKNFSVISDEVNLFLLIVI